MNEIFSQSVENLALKIKDSELTSVELCEKYIERIDKFEKEVYNHSNYITGTTIDYSFLKKVSDFIKDDPIHISFDVDSIDPIYIPSTGTKVKNGLSVQKAKMLLDFLYKYKKNQIVNIDLCELNLSIGSIEDSKLSLNNTLHLFSKYI